MIVEEKGRVEEILLAIKRSKAEIRSLLTTPLLLTLLVIIYNSTQEIPESLADFYDALFYTLLTRHDKSKPGFRRKRETGLSDSELRRLFEAFCYAARQQSLLVLKDSNIVSLVEGASSATSISAKPEAFAHDISKVACLMQQEGFEYHFIHKSVVEFHAASFISRTTEDIARRFYASMPIKWHKWRQELAFLSQIDRHRYLKYFYLEAATRALREFEIEGAGSRISEETAKRLLNVIAVSATEGPKGLDWHYEVVSDFTFVSYELTLKATNHSITQLINANFSAVFQAQEQSQRLGIWDFLCRVERQDTGMLAANSAVRDFLKELKLARLTLSMEERVGEFVAP